MGAATALNDITLMDDDSRPEPAGAADGDDWTAEDELPSNLTSVVDAQLKAAQEDLTKVLQLEAAKWAIGNKLLPRDEKKPELTAQLGALISIRKEAATSKVPDFGASLSEMEKQECVAAWRQRMSTLFVQMRSATVAKSALAVAEPWVTAVLDAKREVMDPNEQRLSEHLEGMWTEQVSAAKKELAGSRLRDVMKAHARTINGSLKAAMDDVEGQFCDGMTPIVAGKVGAALDASQVPVLVRSAIRSFRVGFDRPWDIKTLEKQLLPGMQIDQAERDALALAEATEDAARPPPPIKATSDATSDPVGFLLGLVLGSVELPVAEDVRNFLWTSVAVYLDPFIDGEVPASQYDARSEGWFMTRLKARWVALNGEGAPPLPVSPFCALAAYVSHCICKMNTQLGFGPHTPGLGRQPSSEMEAARLHAQLGQAVVDAIQRDFDVPDRAFGSLPALRSENIVHVARIHLNGLVAYQNELGAALTVANRDGEEARREERMRIWGYA